MLGTVALGLLVFWMLYVWTKWRWMLRYWTEKGVKHEKPFPLVGNVSPFSPFPFEKYCSMYRRFTGEKVVGLFEFNTPKVVIRDPELVQKVLVKNFPYFMDRGVDQEIAEETSGLLPLVGMKWRAMRACITPSFSSGKLKTMMREMVDCGGNLASFLTGIDPSQADTRELLFSFTTDVIATTAYGLEATSLTRPDSKFRKAAVKAFKVSIPRFLGVTIVGKLPFIRGKFKVGLVPWDVAKFFTNVARNTLEARKESGRIRNDFVQLLLDLKEKGVIVWSAPGQTGPPFTLDVTEEMIISQAFTFLLAGSEPVANTLLYTLVELSKDLEIQEEVRNEINSAIEEAEGINKEAIQKMPLVKMCLQETLRLYPVTPHLVRIVTKEVELIDGLVLEKGIGVVVPIAALQKDPQYFPEPEAYRPRRFQKQPLRGTYAPFGEGPRKCIGMRYAMQEMMIGLAVILHRFKVYPSLKTEKIEFKKWSFLTSPSHPVYLNYMDVHPLHCTWCPVS